MEELSSLLNDKTNTLASANLPLDMTLVVISALIFGIAIALTYMKTKKDGYQQGFIITLAMLPIILSVIILFIGSNIARAFSLAGTLSLIRFRSAPGDPKDIGYIFFATAAGVGVGVGIYVYVAIFVAIMCIFLLILSKIDFGAAKSGEMVLKILVPENMNFNHLFDDILDKYTTNYKRTRIKTADLGSVYEVDYRITLPETVDDHQLIDELRTETAT